MTTSNINRLQLIQGAMARCAGEPADVAIQLWGRLASKLTSIMGRGGFNALLSRSIYIVNAEFPWLRHYKILPSSHLPFADLKIDLANQNPVEARKASIALLLTFTDILASLIGESLTFDLINSAWRENFQDMDIQGKGI